MSTSATVIEVSRQSLQPLNPLSSRFAGLSNSLLQKVSLKPHDKSSALISWECVNSPLPMRDTSHGTVTLFDCTGGIRSQFLLPTCEQNGS